MSFKHVFTPLEKKTFKDILKKFDHIVENKNTDGSTLRTKNEAWKRITTEYNANPHTIREVTNKQLKRLWMNLKQRQREALKKERQQRLATRGGPTTVDVVIEPDISPALVVGNDEAINSDTLPETSQSENGEVSTQSILNTSCISSASNADLTSATTSSPDPSVITQPVAPTAVTPHLPKTAKTSLPPSTIVNPLPCRSISTPLSTVSTTIRNNNILNIELREQQRRAEELHELEKELLKTKIREAMAKAELAELLLRQQKSISYMKEE